MRLSEQLKQDHESGDFGDALEGYSERAAGLEMKINRLRDDLCWLLKEAVDESNFWTNDEGWERIEKIRALLGA